MGLNLSKSLSIPTPEKALNSGSQPPRSKPFSTTHLPINPSSIKSCNDKKCLATGQRFNNPSNKSSAPASRKATGCSGTLHLDTPLKAQQVFLDSDSEPDAEETLTDKLSPTNKNNPMIKRESSELLTAPFATKYLHRSFSGLEETYNADIEDEIKEAEKSKESKYSVKGCNIGKSIKLFENDNIYCERCKKLTSVQNRAKAQCGHVFHFDCITDSKLCPVCGEIVENNFMLGF